MLGGSGVKGLDDVLSAGHVEGVLLVVAKDFTHHWVAANVVNKGLVHWDSNLGEPPIVSEVIHSRHVMVSIVTVTHILHVIVTKSKLRPIIFDWLC